MPLKNRDLIFVSFTTLSKWLHGWAALGRLISRGEGWWSEAYSNPIGGRGVLGQGETRKNHQRKNNMQANWAISKSFSWICIYKLECTRLWNLLLRNFWQQVSNFSFLKVDWGLGYFLPSCDIFRKFLIKVAGVVNIKLTFTDRFFYNWWYLFK